MKYHNGMKHPIVIHYKEAKQIGKHNHSIFEVLQDLQPNYKQDIEQLQLYKQEIEWMWDYQEHLEDVLDARRDGKRACYYGNCFIQLYSIET